jgi:hypothetical protein
MGVAAGAVLEQSALRVAIPLVETAVLEQRHPFLVHL